MQKEKEKEVIFYIDGQPSPFYGEPSPRDVHNLYMDFGPRIDGVQELFEHECSNLYTVNGLYPMLVGAGPGDAPGFYGRHSGLESWDHYVGPAVVAGVVEIGLTMMWMSIDDYLLPTHQVDSNHRHPRDYPSDVRTIARLHRP